MSSPPNEFAHDGMEECPGLIILYDQFEYMMLGQEYDTDILDSMVSSTTKLTAFGQVITDPLPFVQH